MKNLILALLCFGLGSIAQADHVTPKVASARIKKVVEAFTPFAWSGVSHYKVKKGLSVRETMEAIAKKEGHDEFDWAQEDQDAWEADSTLWGWSNMAGARSYLFGVEDDFFTVKEEQKKGGRAKYEAMYEKAKETFAQLNHTGVTFGIAPLGAVQCGIRFAALAVINPHTGDVWIIALEGSGC